VYVVPYRDPSLRCYATSLWITVQRGTMVFLQKQINLDYFCVND
jgi:hypothetical protein